MNQTYMHENGITEVEAPYREYRTKIVPFAFEGGIEELAIETLLEAA